MFVSGLIHWLYIRILDVIFTDYKYLGRWKCWDILNLSLSLSLGFSLLPVSQGVFCFWSSLFHAFFSYQAFHALFIELYVFLPSSYSTFIFCFLYIWVKILSSLFFVSFSEFHHNLYFLLSRQGSIWFLVWESQILQSVVNYKAVFDNNVVNFVLKRLFYKID